MYDRLFGGEGRDRSVVDHVHDNGLGDILFVMGESDLKDIKPGSRFQKCLSAFTRTPVTFVVDVLYLRVYIGFDDVIGYVLCLEQLLQCAGAPLWEPGVYVARVDLPVLFVFSIIRKEEVEQYQAVDTAGNADHDAGMFFQEIKMSNSPFDQNEAVGDVSAFAIVERQLS